MFFDDECTDAIYEFIMQEYVLRIVKLASPCTRVPIGILRNTVSELN